MQALRRPLMFVIECALEGCGARVFFPVTLTTADAGDKLIELGWRCDPDSGGFLCGRHRAEVVNA